MVDIESGKKFVNFDFLTYLSKRIDDKFVWFHLKNEFIEVLIKVTFFKNIVVF